MCTQQLLLVAELFAVLPWQCTIGGNLSQPLRWKLMGFVKLSYGPGCMMGCCRRPISTRTSEPSAQWRHPARTRKGCLQDFLAKCLDLLTPGAMPQVNMEMLFGLPAKGVSRAGKRMGLEDPRTNLITEVFRVADHLDVRLVCW